MNRIWIVLSFTMTMVTLVACAPEKNSKVGLLLAALALSDSGTAASSDIRLAGQPMAQKVQLQSGVAFKYKVDLSSVASDPATMSSGQFASSIQRLSASATTIDLSLLDPNGIVVKAVGNDPGTAIATLEYTPPTGGTYIIQLKFNQPLAPASITPVIEGGNPETSVGAAETVLAPANPTRMINLFINNGMAMVIYGTIANGVFAPTPGATVQVKVGSTTCNLAKYDTSQLAAAGKAYTYNGTWSSSGCGGADYSSTKTVQLILTDSANGISFTSNAVQIPKAVSAVKIDGVSLNGSTSFSVSKSSSHTVAYTMPADTLPTTLAILTGKASGGEPGKTINILAVSPVAASQTGSITVPASLGSVMTTANDVDGYGLASFLSGNWAMLLDYATGGTYTGVDGSTNNFAASFISVAMEGNPSTLATESALGWGGDSLTVTE